MNMASEKSEQTPLIEVIIRDDPECIDELLQKGADMNAVDSAGKTPLNICCGKRKLQH